MWIVMTSSAQMPTTCRGRYSNVALVKLTQEFTAYNRRPAMISTRARGVLRVVHMGHHHVGRGNSGRDAFTRARGEADRRAHELNNAAPIAEAHLLMTWGGSA